MAYANITHTKRLLNYWTSSFPGLGQHIRATTGELRPRNCMSPGMQDTRVHRLLYAYDGCGTYSQATPGLLNACITVCDEFASRPDSKPIFTSEYDITLHRRTRHRYQQDTLCYSPPSTILRCTRGEASEKIFISSKDGASKSTETRHGWENFKNPTPLRNDARPLSGPQRNALASLVHFVV